ncbi:hypothetical protein T439DRAFT_125021 [Meredithblackwellia eburnea MCA 4105]
MLCTQYAPRSPADAATPKTTQSSSPPAPPIYSLTLHQTIKGADYPPLPCNPLSEVFLAARSKGLTSRRGSCALSQCYAPVIPIDCCEQMWSTRFLTKFQTLSWNSIIPTIERRRAQLEGAHFALPKKVRHITLAAGVRAESQLSSPFASQQAMQQLAKKIPQTQIKKKPL